MIVVCTAPVTVAVAAAFGVATENRIATAAGLVGAALSGGLAIGNTTTREG